MGGVMDHLARAAARRFTIEELCAEWETTLQKRLSASGHDRVILDHLLGTWAAAIAEKVIEGGLIHSPVDKKKLPTNRPVETAELQACNSIQVVDKTKLSTADPAEATPKRYECK